MKRLAKGAAEKERKKMLKLAMTSKINGEELKTLVKSAGSFKQDGQTYVLLQQAYADNNKYQEAAFFARAVKIDDEIIAGVAPTYMVEWEITDHDTEDDGNACDWDNPISVKDCSYVDLD